MRVPFLEKQLRKLLRAAQTIMTSLDGRGEIVSELARLLRL